MGKFIARLTMICAVGALALAPVASAYKVPGIPPGKPGGPPTKPKGGNGTSKGAAKAIGKDLAGFTDLELANLGSFTVKLHLPKPGTMLCTVAAGSTPLGAGSATSTKGGKKVNLTVKFTKNGKKFLKAHNGQATTLTVTCTFTPKKGKSATSIATLKTFP
jgi:hypothetical protein